MRFKKPAQGPEQVRDPQEALFSVALSVVVW